MPDPRPIGVFDSGVGGLAVLAEIRRLLPAEDLVYFADTAHFPYGEKPEEEVRARSEAVVERLIERGVKLVVVACNTATSAAADHLRERFPLPFVAMEPAVKPAAARTRTGRIAVLATEGTLEGRRLASLVQRYANGAKVLTLPGTGLAEAVERGDLAPEALLRRALAPLEREEVDTLALGCTHYFFLRPAIERILGPRVEVIDTAEPVARRVRQVLDELDLAAPPGRQGRVTYLTSGDPEAFARVRERLLAGSLAGAAPGEGR
jgi:glutamate racemase